MRRIFPAADLRRPLSASLLCSSVVLLLLVSVLPAANAGEEIAHLVSTALADLEIHGSDGEIVIRGMPRSGELELHTGELERHMEELAERGW